MGVSQDSRRAERPRQLPTRARRARCRGCAGSVSADASITTTARVRAISRPRRRRRVPRGRSDDALVARVRAGDERAFELVFDRYHRGLLAFCRHMLASDEEAEDALQHTFMAAYRALGAGD